MLRFILALIFAAFATVAPAQPLTTKPSFTDMLTANCTAAHVLLGGAVSPGCGPTPTRAGDLMYYNGTTWVSLAGNNSGTQVFSENASGIPAWLVASGAGTVISVTCGTGLSGGTFTSSGTCALSAATTNLTDVTSAGSWTPADNSGASLTFAGVSANYTKIGNMVFAYVQLNYPSTTSGASASISGLPVAVPNHPYAQQCNVSYSNSTSVTGMRAVAVPNTSTISLYSGAGVPVTNANMTTFQINLMCIYPAS